MVNARWHCFKGQSAPTVWLFSIPAAKLTDPNEEALWMLQLPEIYRGYYDQSMLLPQRVVQSAGGGGKGSGRAVKDVCGSFGALRFIDQASLGSYEEVRGHSISLKWVKCHSKFMGEFCPKLIESVLVCLLFACLQHHEQCMFFLHVVAGAVSDPEDFGVTPEGIWQLSNHCRQAQQDHRNCQYNSGWSRCTSEISENTHLASFSRLQHHKSDQCFINSHIWTWTFCTLNIHKEG